MAELRRWAGWGIAALAVVVMFVGLQPGNAAPIDGAARAQALAAADHHLNHIQIDRLIGTDLTTGARP